MQKTTGNILIVDDDPGVLHSAQMFLKQLFDNVITTTHPSEISLIVKTENIDVILLDMNFTKGEIDGEEGMHLLDKILEIDEDLPVIFITAYGDFDLAVNAIKSGAHDFIVKPWKNQKLHASVLSALKIRESKRESHRYKETTKRLSDDQDVIYNDFIGESLPMQHVKDLVQRVATTNADVLITGENGTGKEMVARQIHLSSKRHDQVFMKVDVGAIHENLFESELFGHEKGAFTDAKKQKPGRFELASGGTLFIDEIGNLDSKLQAKLLSVLQNREIFRVGSTKSIPIDVRLICATNQNLKEMIKSGTFREDLFYRINMFEILLPPLSERYDDIEAIASHYFMKFKEKYNKPKLKLLKPVVERIKMHDWPGNIRELKNAIERCVILAQNNSIALDTIFPSHRSHNTRASRETLNIIENEKLLILEAIQKSKGNMTKAAQELGLERTALYRRMKKFGL